MKKVHSIYVSIPHFQHGVCLPKRPLNLIHWGRVTHICVGKLTTIGADNGLSPGRRQAIIWTIAGILLFGPLGTNFGEILIGIQTFSFKKMPLKMSSAKWRPSCLGLNVLNDITLGHPEINELLKGMPSLSHPSIRVQIKDTKFWTCYSKLHSEKLARILL